MRAIVNKNNKSLKLLKKLLKNSTLVGLVNFRMEFFKQLGHNNVAIFDYSGQVDTILYRRLATYHDRVNTREGNTKHNITELKPYKVDIFSEASFCLLTANFRADRSILIQAEIGINGFYNFSKNKLVEILREYGHRFAKQRAERIVLLRNQSLLLQKAIKIAKEDVDKARDLLVANINGYGLKEASHFLRNVGVENVAIVDRHIYSFIKDLGYKPKYKTLCKSEYLRAEKFVLDLARKLNIPAGALDLYMFYAKTGTILK